MYLTSYQNFDYLKDLSLLGAKSAQIKKFFLGSGLASHIDVA
jgi:hypothetical protein